jgi:hypothetical protein
MTKTAAAFSFTADKLSTPGMRTYFWTFTFQVVQNDWDAMRMFSDFVRHLRMVLPGDWGGVRVAELHKEHGLHFHALINRRLAVQIVRRVARCHGIGRIHVCAAAESAVKYLAKYLWKQVKTGMTKSGRSIRRWASFGQIRKTRVCDVVNESPMWVYRRERGLAFLSYRYEFLLRRLWDYGEDYLRRGWELARDGNIGDLMRLVNGSLVMHGSCEMHEPLRVQAFVAPF